MATSTACESPCSRAKLKDSMCGFTRSCRGYHTHTYSEPRSHHSATNLVLPVALGHAPVARAGQMAQGRHRLHPIPMDTLVHVDVAKLVTTPPLSNSHVDL